MHAASDWFILSFMIVLICSTSVVNIHTFLSGSLTVSASLYVSTGAQVRATRTCKETLPGLSSHQCHHTGGICRLLPPISI